MAMALLFTMILPGLFLIIVPVLYTYYTLYWTVYSTTVCYILALHEQVKASIWIRCLHTQHRLLLWWIAIATGPLPLRWWTEHAYLSLPWHSHHQSWYVAMLLCWYACALARVCMVACTHMSASSPPYSISNFILSPLFLCWVFCCTFFCVVQNSFIIVS